MADRVERLTNLLALLLETIEPLALTQIVAELDGQYSGSDASIRQAFERDKAALRSIGVPIDTIVHEGTELAGQTRYRIDRGRYELADLELEADEMRALQVAVATTRPSGGRDALWKLGGALDDDRAAVTAVLPDHPELPTFRAAVASRSLVEFGYGGERRSVEPWGVLLRGGFWYLVGFDHLRGAKRTFRVDRIDGAASVGEPGGFERPADFDPRDAFPRDPKQIGHASDDGFEALVRIDRVRAAAVEREVGSDCVEARSDDGSIEVRVPATNLPAFRSWVLGLTTHAVVLEPDEVRRDLLDWLARSIDDEAVRR
ncbi:MAG: WYL domain-containing protein [Actinomycetota bacterium]